METAVIAVATVVSVCASFYLFALTQIKFLKANWPKYRCNPIYMPMAGLVGQDVTANFTKCTMKGFQDYAGFVMDPIMSQFSLFNSVIGDISSSMNDMRGMMSDVRGGFLGIVGTVFGKIENLMSQFQYIIIRMRTLLARTVGIMMSFMYIFYGGMQTGESVTNGPIGKTISVLCFDGSTMIDMNDGSSLPISSLQIGSVLKGNNTVMSTYVINGANIPMYTLGPAKVSGSHSVIVGNKYVPVSTHTDAVPTTPSTVLYCINTSKNSIAIGNYQLLDFTENISDHFMNYKRQTVETLYNGSTNPANAVNARGDLYPRGVSAMTLVSLQSGPTVISEVKVGDVLDNGDTVIGLVTHNVQNVSVCALDTGILIHPYVWVYANGNVQAATGTTNYNPSYMLFYHLITGNSMYPILSSTGNRYMILDEIESPKLKSLL